LIIVLVAHPIEYEPAKDSSSLNNDRERTYLASKAGSLFCKKSLRGCHQEALAVNECPYSDTLIAFTELGALPDIT
jgi:hypothetical protein